MALYKLPFALFPVRDIYARDKKDIAAWLEWFAEQDIKVLKHNPGASAGVEQIIEVSKGAMAFDFGGLVAGNKFAEISLTEDFIARVRFESVPYFKSWQSRLKSQEAGNLNAVKNYYGKIQVTNYVPQDVFQALCSCDVSGWEAAAEEHIQQINQRQQQLQRGGHFYASPLKGDGKFN